MSLITLAPPYDDGVARQAQVIGDVFPSVVVAAAAGADWAWTALHRCVAPPATGYLHAAGAVDPHRAFEHVFAGIARDFASFDGDETEFRMWVFELAHEQVTAGLPRRRRPTCADLLVLSRLSEGPAIPAAVERAHVTSAVAAVRQVGPGQRHRPAHGRGGGMAGLSLSTLLALVLGPLGKAAAGMVLAAGATTGILALDPLPREPAVRVQAAAGTAAEAADTAQVRRATGPRTAATAVSRTRATAARAARDNSATTAGKDAGLAKAAATPDQAGAHKDRGLQRAAHAPQRPPSSGREGREPALAPMHGSSSRGPAAVPEADRSPGPINVTLPGVRGTDPAEAKKHAAGDTENL